MQVLKWILCVTVTLTAGAALAQSKGQAHDLRRDADQAYDQKKI